MTPPLSNLPDYYAILQVAPDASPIEVRAAFRQLVKRYHPDLYALNPQVVWEAELLMTRIIEAHTVLSDSARRQAYDKQRLEETARWNQPAAQRYQAGTGASAKQDAQTFTSFSGWRWLNGILQWLSAQGVGSGQKQLMSALSKAILLPVPLCAATAVSAMFWHLGQITGAAFLGGLTAVLSYPLTLIPLLLRLLLPIRYQPLLSQRQKLVCSPAILLVATVLGWLWVVVVDHNGRIMNQLDLYFWCGLIMGTCISLAYL